MLRICTLISLFLFLLLTVIDSSAQNKRDYNWMSANNSGPADGIEGVQFNFNDNSFSIDTFVSPYNYTMNNASISDIDGSLLFYSNGCAVMNQNHEVMSRGDSINAGEWFEIFWDGNCNLGYPGTQDILALPDPYYDEGYYLITKPRFFETQTFLRDFQYSYIDMSLDNGLGEVILKNEVVYDLDTIQSSYLQAVKHDNGKDWWVIQPSEEENRYLFFLIDQSGLNFHHVQSIGQEFHPWAGAGGKAKFSPDGSQFAYYNRHQQLRLFDFDRQTGLLGNLQEIYIDSIPTFNSIEYSASGQFLYFALKTHLYQLDLHNLDDPDALVLIDIWNGVSDPFATVFFLMQRGPDCRIYMCSNSGTNTYHVINEPDEKGTACDFVQQGIQLPYASTTANFPNFPNFRIDEDEYCDPSITSVFGIPVVLIEGLQIKPNPSVDFIDLVIPDKFTPMQMQMFDVQGQLLMQDSFDIRHVDVSTLNSGIYIVRVMLDDGNVMVERFVKG